VVDEGAVEKAEETLQRLTEEIGRVVVGQHGLIEGLLVALLSGGHALVEGVPGLAKTTAIRTLAQVLGLGFGRIQFTPDLLPGDLIGTPVYVPDRRTFVVRRGPIFSPVLLADEINRAPARPWRSDRSRSAKRPSPCPNPSS
jgi:MoxR-like ATPase